MCSCLPYKRFQKLLSQGLLPSLVLFPSKCAVELDWVLCHWGLRALPTAKQRCGITDRSSTLTSASSFCPFLTCLMKALRQSMFLQQTSAVSATVLCSLGEFVWVNSSFAYILPETHWLKIQRRNKKNTKVQQNQKLMQSYHDHIRRGYQLAQC